MQKISKAIDITIYGVNPDRASALTWEVSCMEVDFRIPDEMQEDVVSYALTVFREAMCGSGFLRVAEFAASFCAATIASKLRSDYGSLYDEAFRERVVAATLFDVLRVAKDICAATGTGWTGYEAMTRTEGERAPVYRSLQDIPLEGVRIGDPL